MLAKALLGLSGQNVYMTVEPDVLDFTDPAQNKRLLIYGNGNKIGLPLSSNPDDLAKDTAALPHCIGANEEMLIGWNMKPFFTHYYAKTGRFFHFNQPVWDLSIIEAYRGITHAQAPKSNTEACQRLEEQIQGSGWEGFTSVYGEVYHPIITEVLPVMESQGLVDDATKQNVYSFYELNGQTNGRSKTMKVLKKCYMPHSLTQEAKESLRPEDDSELFMGFDFANMEVSVLQWLSGDRKLKAIIDSGGDVYERIWYEVAGKEQEREKGKTSFLPIVYGIGKVTLAKNMNISIDSAEWLINKYYQTFPDAFGWIREMSLTSEGMATDYFGRKRYFNEDFYKSRNFLVQAPANIICLKKLVTLYEEIKDFAKLVFHVHDGFFILVNRTNWKKAFTTGKTALETTEILFPNLHLTAACKAGRSLNKLSSIKLGG